MGAYGAGRAAGRKVAELFPNLTDADRIIIDVSGAEDQAAGDLGVPFTQVEDKEEWVGWVDWSEVEAHTAGAGGWGLCMNELQTA